jgi:DNA-binding Lrp family transcriptional regulator
MKTPFDRIDFRILAALQKDGRLSNKEIAARVGLAQSSSLARVARLESSGALRGFHAEVDPASLGIELQALIMVRLQRHSRDLVESFKDHVLALPETVALSHVSGANDYMVHVAVRDPEHLRNLLLDAFTSRTEVAHLETSLVFEHTRNWVLPNYLEE